jgi:hypothetical protein
MHVAINKDAKQQHEDAQGGIAIMIHETLRHEMDQTAQVEQKKYHNQILQHYD